MTDKLVDYYAILGLSPQAEPGEIKKAYRVLALKWHPDKNPGDPRAAVLFQQVGEAYRILSDPRQRRMYDRQRAQTVPPGGTCNFQPEAGVRRTATPGRSRTRQSRHLGRRSLLQGIIPRMQNGVPWHSLPRCPRILGRQSLKGWLQELKTLPHRLLTWFAGKSPPGLALELIPSANQADLVMDLHVPRWLAARGAKLKFLLKIRDQRRRLRLTLPAGVKDGAALKVEGAGKNLGDRTGHLYINIRLKD